MDWLIDWNKDIRYQDKSVKVFFLKSDYYLKIKRIAFKFQE